jgi:hypothetical protein
VGTELTGGGGTSSDIAGGGGIGANGTTVVGAGCTITCVVGGSDLPQAATPRITGRTNGKT